MIIVSMLDATCITNPNPDIYVRFYNAISNRQCLLTQSCHQVLQLKNGVAQMVSLETGALQHMNVTSTVEAVDSPLASLPSSSAGDTSAAMLSVTAKGSSMALYERLSEAVATVGGWGILAPAMLTQLLECSVIEGSIVLLARCTRPVQCQWQWQWQWQW